MNTGHLHKLTWSSDAPRRNGTSTAPHSRRGAACVEMAMLSPILLLLIMGIIDLGQYVNIGQSVSNASREGARIAARQTTTDVTKVQSAVTKYLTDMHPGLPNSAVQVTVLNSGGTVTGGNIATVATGLPVTVQVTLAYDSVRWIKGLPFLTGRTVTNSTITRRE